MDGLQGQMDGLQGQMGGLQGQLIGLQTQMVARFSGIEGQLKMLINLMTGPAGVQNPAPAAPV